MKYIPLIILPIAVILLLIFYFNINKEQSINNTINISNFSELYRDIPQDKTDTIQQSLQDAITNNYNRALPHLDANIRTDHPFLYTYNNHLNIYYGNFIVDVPDIQHSYLVQFEWAPEQYKNNLSGYNVLVTCLPKETAIYPNFSCSDILTSQGG